MDLYSEYDFCIIKVYYYTMALNLISHDVFYDFFFIHSLWKCRHKETEMVFNINVHCARYLSTMIILNTDYRRPISLFSLKFQTLSHGRQIGQIKLGAFGVFLAILSALISVLCVPCPWTKYYFVFILFSNQIHSQKKI